jgi:hypothetical protein
MSKHDDRVLSRTGARELTEEEMKKISGSGHNTRASQTPTGTVSSPDENFDS